MASVYKSKVDWWLAILILSAAAVSVWACAVAMAAGSAAAAWFVLPIAGIGAGLPLWILLGTRYTIDAAHIHVSSGPFKWRIPIADITCIMQTSNALSSPALSLDRLRIDYGRGASLMISPRDKAQFIREVEALRRRA